jgi:hypothetical protein
MIKPVGHHGTVFAWIKIGMTEQYLGSSRRLILSRISLSPKWENRDLVILMDA